MSVYIPPLGETNIKKLTAAIHQLAQGRTNANGQLTLNPNQTTTTTSFVVTSATTFVMYWQPTTQHAAGQMATMYCTGVTKGQFIIHHSANPTTDQTFNFEVRG